MSSTAMVLCRDMIDLHTHSTASDGSYSPAALMALAASAGLKAIALTDHDTVGGIGEAAEAARELGIILIPGIEMEVEFSPGEFHLLGLGLRTITESFHKNLSILKSRRHERNEKILSNMKKAGIEATFGELERLAGGDIIGRPHFAQLLVKKGVAKNVQDAFKKYIGKGMKFYEPRQSFILSDATSLIHSAGGKAVVAHPLSLYVSLNKLPEILANWKGFGIDGIEAYHSTATKRECERLAGIARDLDLIITAGSDFHGTVRPERMLGRTAEGMEIADVYLEPFLANERGNA